MKDDFNLETWHSEYKGELPQGFLIIGSDPGANLVLLADGQIETGIFYWDHIHFFNESTDEHNTYRLAQSFSDFLAGLK